MKTQKIWIIYGLDVDAKNTSEKFLYGIYLTEQAAKEAKEGAEKNKYYCGDYEFWITDWIAYG